MDRLAPIVGGIVVVGLVVLMGLGIRDAYREHRKCTDNGGHWVRYNCRQWTSWDCNYRTDTNGFTVLDSCMTNRHESCDRKCVGATPEAAP